MTQLLPEVSARLEIIFREEPNRDKRRSALYACYESFPNISVDYAVIERATNVYMQIGSFGWADMGRWEDVYRYSSKDTEGNMVQSGKAEFYNCRNKLDMDAYKLHRWCKDTYMQEKFPVVYNSWMSKFDLISYDLLSQQLPIADDTDDKCRYGMEITAEDTVGMIGFIKPVAKVLEKQVKKLYVFDEGVSLYEGNMRVCGMDQQPVLLPECTKMIITGSSTINGSIDGLLEMCCNATQIALVGSSTPMFPEGWKGTKGTALAGAWWPKERKDEIFRIISQGGGIAQLRPIIQHKIAFVK